MIIHWLLHFTGADNLAGPIYGLWSGFLGTTLISGATALMRRTLKRHHAERLAQAAKHHREQLEQAEAHHKTHMDLLARQHSQLLDAQAPAASRAAPKPGVKR